MWKHATLVCATLLLALPAYAIEYTNDSTVIRLGVSNATGTDIGGTSAGTSDTGGSVGSQGTQLPPLQDISKEVTGRTDTAPGAQPQTPASDTSNAGQQSAGTDANAGAGTGQSGIAGDVVTYYTPSDVGTSTVSAQAKENAFQKLIGSGALAVSGSGSGTSTGAFGGGVTSGGASWDALPAEWADETLAIDGAKVRVAYTQDAAVFDALLDDWETSAAAHGEAKATKRDYATAAIAAVHYNAGIDDISFHGSRFDIAFRSPSHLLAFIPWRLPVTMRIDTAAPADKRVELVMPWYAWLVWKPFDAATLRNDAAALARVTTKDLVPGGDPQLALFRSITDLLSREAGVMAQ